MLQQFGEANEHRDYFWHWDGLLVLHHFFLDFE